MSAIFQFLRPLRSASSTQNRPAFASRPILTRAFHHHHRRIICAVFLPPAWTQQGVRVALPSADPRLMAKVGAHDGKRHSQARRPHIPKGPQRWRTQMGNAARTRDAATSYEQRTFDAAYRGPWMANWMHCCQTGGARSCFAKAEMASLKRCGPNCSTLARCVA